MCMGIKLNVFGSCVTRDAFDFQNYIKPNIYIARQAVVSSVSRPINIKAEDVLLESDFRKKMVLADLNKTAFDSFYNDPGDGIIIDLIDERFSLIAINGSYITNSNELKESNLFNGSRVIKKRPYKSLFSNGYRLENDNNDIDKYIRRFAKKIKAIYVNKPIIIHKAIFCNEFLDDNMKPHYFALNQQKINIQTNEMLDYMYSSLTKWIPKAVVIDISEKYMADSTHKWGLSPFHYQKEYYIELMQLISNVLNTYYR